MSLRDCVLEFAQAMERELRNNDHKIHWSYYAAGKMLTRLKQEVGELERALRNDEPTERILSEAADVANFAMMVADNVRRERSP